MAHDFANTNTHHACGVMRHLSTMAVTFTTGYGCLANQNTGAPKCIFLSMHLNSGCEAATGGYDKINRAKSAREWCAGKRHFVQPFCPLLRAQF